MMMKATTGAKAARCSWADIVKGASDKGADIVKGASDIATELPQESPAAIEDPAEVVKSSEPLQESGPAPGAWTTVEDPAEVVKSSEPLQGSGPPPGVWTTAKLEAPLDTSAPLKPGSRGGLQCLCRGKVLNMLSHYGWIAAFGDIDHPLAAKHFGRVYIHSKDVVEEYSLSAGDVVSFYLYVDNVGLGAEACRVEPTETDVAPLPKLRKEAVEFVPGGAYNTAVLASGAHGPVSDMFVRMSRAFDSIPANGYVQMAGAINSAFFDSDSSSEDEEDGDADRESLYDESDHSCGEGFNVVQKAKHPWTKAKDMCAELPGRSTSPGMTSDSTNAGTTSESETEGKVTFQSWKNLGLGVYPVHAPPRSRPPPGLEDVVRICV